MRRILVALVAVLVLAATAYAGAALLGMTQSALSEPAPTPSPTSAATPASTRAPTPSMTATVPRTPTPTVEPEPPPSVLSPGDRGVRVRELQGRLSQLAWYVPPMSGTYDSTTRAAVAGFQGKRGFRRSGVVDRRTWRRIVTMSRMPTRDEMFNRAGPALLRAGDDGPDVRVVQARLRQIAWFFGDVSDHYGDRTTDAVRGFQAKRHIPVTGEVDRRTLDLLVGMTSDPTADELANREPDPAEGAPLDPRCVTERALCIDKTSSSLRWVVGGSVRMTLDVRFGSEFTPTREGQFSVYWKDADHVSTLYGSAMPLSMFFSGGQAVHYSSDFASSGYYGASHGCVNVRDYEELESLFAQVSTGDRVVVYRS